MQAATDEAKRLLEEANANFQDALTTAAPVYFAVHGLDAILQAVRLCPDLTNVAPTAAVGIAENGLALTFRISHAIANAFPADEVAIGFGAATSLVTLADDALRIDRVLHVGMLLGNLRAHLCRSEIRRRGDPLVRNMQLHTAWTSVDTTAISLQ